MEMEKVFDRVEKTINYLDDNWMHGAAEMLFIGSIGAVFALFIYCVLAAVTYGYIQIFTLISGSI
jgi:hypothetical protein